MEPSVSVVMTVRNVEKYIANCIKSILDQTFNNFEIVIIDDMSNDNTNNIIEKFNDKRIKCFKNMKWLGISKSRNRGLNHATGEYIFFTDGDCTVSKNWIEEGLKFLKDPTALVWKAKYAMYPKIINQLFPTVLYKTDTGANS